MHLDVIHRIPGNHCSRWRRNLIFYSVIVYDGGLFSWKIGNVKKDLNGTKVMLLHKDVCTSLFYLAMPSVGCVKTKI